MLESLKHEDLQFQELSPEEKQSRGILARLSGPIASFTKGTRNGRKYSDKLWEKAFDSPLVKEMFKNGGLPGELQHPENRSETDPTKIAIMMPEPPKKDSNGHLVASVDILDTPCGQIAYQLGKYGFKFGISSRGEGDLITDFSGEESVDPDTYTLNAFDLVLIPACEDARLQFNEGLDKTKKSRLVTILGESLMNASDADRLVMEEAIDELDIEDNIQFKDTYEGVDIYFDPQDKKYIVYGMDGDEEKFNSESNAQKYVDRFIKESLNESQVGREETKEAEKPSDLLQNKPENNQPSSEVDIQDEEDAELLDDKSLLENLIYKGFLIRHTDDGVSIYDGDGIELYDNMKNIKSAKNIIDDELNTWGPEEAFGGVKLIEEIDSEEGSQDKASWDTDFHRLDVAYNHNFKQFEDMEEDREALKDFTDDLDGQHKKYTIYKHESDPGCTVFFKESLNEDTSWEELNGTEQSAVEAALAELKNGSTIEDAVHGAVEMYNNANEDEEYEDEDFFMEEADYTKVLDYVKSHEETSLKEGAVTPKKDIKLVAKPFNMTMRFGGKETPVESAVVVIPNAIKYSDGTVTDCSVYCEDPNTGDVINFKTVAEAQNWIDEFGNDCLYRIDNGNELHATPSQVYDIDNSEELTEDKYTSDELFDKFGTDNLDIINAGNEETVELAADDNGAIVEQLQDILKRNKSLEEKIKSLQEKLSVGYAKEMELKEEIDTYKQRVSKLSKKTKEIKVLTEKLSKAEQKIKDSSAQAEGKISTLNESISNKDFENKDLRKDISALTETLGKKDSLIKSLDEQLGKAKEKLCSKQDDIEQLKEKYETGQKDLEQLKTQYANKIEQQNQIIEKYQRVAKNSVKRYIESQAVRLGVKSDEIVNRLPKNYSFNDIDTICEDLQEYKFNMSNLPFSQYGLNENLKVTAKNVSKGLVEANPDDEITEYDLKIAEAYI